MILINLSHPLTGSQKEAVEKLTEQSISRLIEKMPYFEVAHSFAKQATELVDSLGLTPSEWQQAPLLINLPALNFATATVLAELHGRCGYFPPIIRLKPVEASLPQRYEVAEIINLQALRDAARKKRGS